MSQPRTVLDDSVDDEDHALWELAQNSSSVEIERFRLLIIGRSGCGKTTILSKVCGEEVADKPGTTRGVHNIEKEMEFKDNKLFVVHDSEGFEAGKDDEFRVVANFIQSHGVHRNINDRLHAIWYCLTTNSRPIQQSEEMFFSVNHGVPIVVIFTKFDLLVEDQLQELMENAEDPEDLDEELERQAEKMAMEKFEKHYKGALLRKPYPPQAVVGISNIHKSTPMDSRLAELIQATSRALNLKTDKADTQAKLNRIRLRSLFAAAQMADLKEKYRVSVYHGTPYDIMEGTKAYRFLCLIETWNTVWTNNTKPILSRFTTHVESHPQTLGNELSLERPKMKTLRDLEKEACRYAQLVSDLTVIMAEIFLLEVKDEATVEEIMKRYPSTPAFSFIQDQVIELNWSSAYPESGKLIIWNYHKQIEEIIDGAVRLNTASESDVK